MATLAVNTQGCMNRSPAFSFYPDKWQSHTRRLSDSAYRLYHELLCWMWQHADDHCSVQASPEAVACAVAMPLDTVRIALTEIQNPFSPLLKCEGEKWISNGLRKEALKQGERREKAKSSADARWKGASGMRSHKNVDANAQVEQCFPSPSPSPSPKEEVEPSAPFSCGTCSAAFEDGEQIQGEPQQEKKAPSFHTQFIAAWSEAYLAVRGEKYLVTAGKDGSAVKRIASMGLSVAELIALACRAWASSGPKFWHCEKAITISYFVSSFNEIRAELSAKPTPTNATHSKNPSEHPRNRFIAGAGTGPTTSEIIKRNKERAAAECAAREAAERLSSPAGPVAGQVAPATEHASSDFGSL